MISQSTIEEVKNRANLIEIVGESVSLKRQGSQYVGLCPFHTEKTPSFHIRDDSLYYCFGCGAAGNIISYVMQTRGLSFPEAIEFLASRFGVQIKYEGKSTGKMSPEGGLQVLYRINQEAASFFNKALQGHNSEVQHYVQERGLSPAAIKTFSIGFAPKNWNLLSNHLQQKSYKAEVLISSGLAKRNQRGELFDVFRGRLMFPIFSDGKRIIGFGGRVIPALLEESSSTNTPKYLNTSETLLFSKGKTLFGLPQALSAMREQKHVYIVEGYMDVVSLWQVGLRQVVGVCGTALTERHVNRLARLVNKVILLFDGDQAGRRAAARSFATFLNSGLSCVVVFLSEGEDPDSLAKKHGDKTVEIIEKMGAKTLLECFIEDLLFQSNVKKVTDLSPASKGKLSQEVATLLRSVKNSIEQNELINQAALKLQVESRLLQKLMLGAQGGGEASKQAVPISLTPESPVAQGNKLLESFPRLDRELLYAVMGHREEIPSLVLKDADLCLALLPETREFIETIKDILDCSESSLDQKKEKISLELKQKGEAWIKHWKRAHEMKEDETVDLLRLFKQCKDFVGEQKLKSTLKIMEDSIKTCQGEEELMVLSKGIVLLNKQLRKAVSAQ